MRKSQKIQTLILLRQRVSLILRTGTDIDASLKSSGPPWFERWAVCHSIIHLYQLFSLFPSHLFAIISCLSEIAYPLKFIYLVTFITIYSLFTFIEFFFFFANHSLCQAKLCLLKTYLFSTCFQNCYLNLLYIYHQPFLHLSDKFVFTNTL